MCVLSLGFLGNAQSDKETRKVKHVVVLGFDGLSPNGLLNVNTPTFDKLMLEGSFSLHARAVLPTDSSPNWASMIMGASPAQHGITSNGWEVDDHVLSPVVEDASGIFPTIFNIVHKQIPDSKIGVIYDWGGFGRLFEKWAVDYDVNPADENETVEMACAYIEENKADLTFVHFDHIDHAGHKYGHGSPEYYKAIEKADQFLKQIMNSIKKANMENETLVIVSSDHGGKGKGHGGETMGEMEIPFIIWGKGVKKNHEIIHTVYQYDNAATVAFALGVKQPWAWIGRPVKTAFEGYELEDDHPLKK